MVCDIIGKHLQVHLSVATPSQARNLGMFCNPTGMSINLVSKTPSKPALLLFVVVRGIIELIRRLQENDDLHGPK